MFSKASENKIISLISQIQNIIFITKIQMKIHEDGRLNLECFLNQVKHNETNWNSGLVTLKYFKKKTMTKTTNIINEELQT